MWVQSLAQELPHATGSVKKPKTKNLKIVENQIQQHIKKITWYEQARLFQRHKDGSLAINQCDIPHE